MAGVPAREFRGFSFFEAVESDVWKQLFPDTAPLLLEQYCCSHILGTDDGAALGPIRVGVVELTVRKFQPFLATGENACCTPSTPELRARCDPGGRRPARWE